MPRRNRCFVPGLPYHMTQRGVDRGATFSDEGDHRTYAGLLREHLDEAGVRLLGWCLMTNHLHLVAVPMREDGLSVLSRRVHGRYAQYSNARWARSGHLWQNRFFACALGPAHLWAALAYVERNPVRAGMVAQAEAYRWSSAAAHLGGEDRNGIADMEWWARQRPAGWSQMLVVADEDTASRLRQCTYAGRPFGDEDFLHTLGERFGRKWTPGRPRKHPDGSNPLQSNQGLLF